MIKASHAKSADELTKMFQCCQEVTALSVAQLRLQFESHHLNGGGSGSAASTAAPLILRGSGGMPAATGCTSMAARRGLVAKEVARGVRTCQQEMYQLVGRLFGSRSQHFCVTVRVAWCLSVGWPLRNGGDRLVGKIEMRILMVGLDAAAETTILYKLQLGEVVTTITTNRLSTLRLLGTRICASLFGTSEARTRSVLSGATVMKEPTG